MNWWTSTEFAKIRNQWSGSSYRACLNTCLKYFAFHSTLFLLLFQWWLYFAKRWSELELKLERSWLSLWLPRKMTIKKIKSDLNLTSLEDSSCLNLTFVVNNFETILGHPNWRHMLYSYNCLSLDNLFASAQLCVSIDPSELTTSVK